MQGHSDAHFQGQLVVFGNGVAIVVRLWAAWGQEVETAACGVAPTISEALSRMPTGRFTCP